MTEGGGPESFESDNSDFLPSKELGSKRPKTAISKKKVCRKGMNSSTRRDNLNPTKFHIRLFHP